MHQVAPRTTDVLPEWEAFAAAVQQRSPDAGTWCEAWTVRDIVVHQAGNADELGRVLAQHLSGIATRTRPFSEREAPYRAMADADLWATFLHRLDQLSEIAQAAAERDPDTDVAWTGRTMKIGWFAEHMREELVLHRWDVTGDDTVARSDLGTSWMTEHSVRAVGRPLLARGAAQLAVDSDGPVEGRLRVAGCDDVLVRADADGTAIELVPPEGPAAIETDAAARTLLLWGRRPLDPSRWRSGLGPEKLRRLRTLLNGY
jgi:uncharacterized protein (TIGR03083 family)